MALEDYRRKREFSETPEPAGVPGQRSGARPIFVVQLHHASRRHYDFRLQVGDVLKSWAVPKGPSFDPKVKRMAVEVEDHPLDYASFEGDIPKGQYGGGHVALFDTGTWTTNLSVEAQLAKGHLRFELQGDKLKGGWHLVRSGKPARQPQWLLFKDDDAWAGFAEADDLLEADTLLSKKAAKPLVAKKSRRKIDWAAMAMALPGSRVEEVSDRPPAPQLAKSGERPPDGDGWLHELKWDGYRLMCTVRSGEVRLWSRNGLDWTTRVPEVRDALAVMRLQEAVLDGELIAGQGSREDFNLLQQILSGDVQGTLRYVLFDVLHLEGIELSRVPLLERKQLLERLLEGAPARLAYSSHGIGGADVAFRAAVDAGFEGLVSKRVDSRVHSGRSDAWRKAKALTTHEYAVVGYTPPKGARNGIGALLLATPDPDHGWRYVGRVGSGLDDAQLLALGKQLRGNGTSIPSVHVPDNDTDLRQARWLAKPALVVEVFTRGHGGRGLLRQASFKAMRPDKSIDSLVDTERPAASTTASRHRKANNVTTKKEPVAKSARKGKDAYKRKAPAISSPDKVLFPEGGITKRELADYYENVMDWLLPEVRDRPLSLVRCPGGIGTQCFFQRHATPGLELVSLIPVIESDGGSQDYLVATDAASLIELVQFNAIEFHPWGSKVANIDYADRLVFDLDPDESVAWKDVIAAARQLRGFLEQAGLQSFVRTSGGKGLHLVVPLQPAAPWERARAFSQAVAEAAREMDPLRYVATASKQKRKGKIFIDWLRNGRGATSVASFSARARPGAPVAMPLRWSELGRVANGHAFNIRNTPTRLKRLKTHPWKGIGEVLQSLPD